MTQYLYPQNLKATANLWLWGLRDFCILGIAALLSIVALVQLRFFIPAAVTLCYGFLIIRMDDTTVLDKNGGTALHPVPKNRRTPLPQTPKNAEVTSDGQA